MKEFYFSKFEHRVPYQNVKENPVRDILFQFVSLLTIMSGLVYFHWRWTSSINFDVPVFSFTLIIAETLSFIGICLFIFDLWSMKDFKKQSAPHYLSDISDLNGQPDRPISIDFFIATYNEEIELVRYTIRDAKLVELPYPDMVVKIWVLDDGKRDGRDPSRENLKQMCAEEGVNYLCRENNIGFKAGNLKNGIDHSDGDLFVILDADTRPFKDFLKNMTGYFRRKKVIWVQSCHWFFDTTEPIPLSRYLIKTFNISSEWMKKTIRFLSFNFKTGTDIYGSDPRPFYEVIQRKRNFHNASFCCGASSIHRREAVMITARNYHAEITEKKLLKYVRQQKITNPLLIEEKRMAIAAETEVRPFLYHASEDFYTSMIVHADKNRWESVLHPHVESKFLSPQDIDTFMKQRSRYAKGSIDIAFHDNPLFKKGLTLSQRLCYFHAVWSYFSCLWTIVFLLCPIVFFFTGLLPVNCTATDFFTFFAPFFLIGKVSELLGSWGASKKRGRQYYICLFYINFLSLISVIRGEKVKFKVTAKSRQATHPFRFVWPHILIVSLTLAGIISHLLMVALGVKEMSVGITLSTFWGIQNVFCLIVIIRAAFWNTETLTEEEAAKTDTSGKEQVITV